MPEQITPQSLEEFRRRFSTHDTVIREIKYWIQDGTNISIIMEGVNDLTVSDRSDPKARIALILTFQDIERFFVKKDRNRSLVLVGNLIMDYFDDEIYLDIMGTSRYPRTKEDYEEKPSYFDEIEYVRSVALILVAKRGFWSIMEPSDDALS